MKPMHYRKSSTQLGIVHQEKKKNLSASAAPINSFAAHGFAVYAISDIYNKSVMLNTVKGLDRKWSHIKGNPQAQPSIFRYVDLHVPTLRGHAAGLAVNG